ncbi:pyridoxine/pyridoxamine 5'-phosphate oxidase [Aureimonas endophytica]|uniref:Pyridoxine/pyridoxamine 5'-phosphate oxidase n=1 Tax=Aureimonas endophytica TaxID=2027858 RepID=A0A916ZUW5_9HYPH|nr:pyridoxamine 5'-phosphate oxidase [Aureimonas endophytica]GGE14432.1 pyridoxine/pyridoxamine 5'-phosphate oxidase [Aureimonas endophytica]
MTNESLTLGETVVGEEPFGLFADWLREAEAAEINDPNAMALATVDTSGLPDVRMVLLKGFDARGFVFYTNFESAKGQELLATRKAALCFHWKTLRRQVRVRGPVEIVSEADADAYYVSRPRGSRLGAWASQQSRPLASRRVLIEAVDALDKRYGEGEIPRPPHWSGFRVLPQEIEFWKDGEFRLHDRILFKGGAETQGWERVRLYP